MSVVSGWWQLYEEALKKAENFLFEKTQSGKLKNLYVRAVTAYALTLMDSSSIPSLTLYEGLHAAATVKGKLFSGKVIGNVTVIQ